MRDRSLAHYEGLIHKEKKRNRTKHQVLMRGRILALCTSAHRNEMNQQFNFQLRA